jgi:hypothetical protein
VLYVCVTDAFVLLMIAAPTFSVASSRTSEEGGHTEYTIVTVGWDGKKAKSHHRYSDWIAFHQAMKTAGFEVGALPVKKMFAKGKQVVTDRKDALDVWIKKLAGDNESIIEDADFMGFVSLKKKPKPKPKKEAAPPPKPPTPEPSSSEESEDSDDGEEVQVDAPPPARMNESEQGIAMAVCPAHVHQAITLYCERTRTLCCASCVISGGRHENDKCVSLEKMTTTQYQSLMDKIQNLKVKEHEKQNFFNSLQGLRSKLLEDSAAKQVPPPFILLLLLL